ncbi:hypothetical protein LOAG_03579 [Loa loa]|uniref:Uncharacterized protein n=1 Tax=Loa loa TaxID=7209 RepID=A0A1S0U467_LOALO|nr:hypothetical protein LOAG_03579 [Loa loa]EFO24914.1 hypothetical protein LOAG_03579 [Loa loa]
MSNRLISNYMHSETLNSSFLGIQNRIFAALYLCKSKTIAITRANIATSPPRPNFSPKLLTLHKSTLLLQQHYFQTDPEHNDAIFNDGHFLSRGLKQKNSTEVFQVVESQGRRDS